MKMKILLGLISFLVVDLQKAQKPILLKDCNGAGDGGGYYFSDIGSKTIFTATDEF